MNPLDAHNDVALAIGLLALGGLFSVLWWFVRGKFTNYDRYHAKHFDHAAKPEIHRETLSRETLDLILKGFNDKVDQHTRDDERRYQEFDQHRAEIRKTLHWLGDCMLTIGVTLKVKLPERPE